MTRFHLNIDPVSGLPVYRQIVDQIKYYIASGALKPGFQLPSVRELARRLCINPTTVVKAYAELEHDEAIEILHGKGAFVANRSNIKSDFNREKVVRRLARQLAVESVQAGAEFELVKRILEEEWEQMAGVVQPKKAVGE